MNNIVSSILIVSILSIKKVFITEARVRDESYFDNVICLFGPTKLSTSLIIFF